MALITEIPPGLTPPPLHSRAWYKTSRQSQTVLRNFKRKHVPTNPNANTIAKNYFGQTDINANRLWTAYISHWWGIGNIPNGKAWWDALAAANAIETEKGTVKVVTGKQFFLRYQHNARVVAVGCGNPFNPADLPNPIAPVLPWAPPPAPTFVDGYAIAPHTVYVEADFAPDTDPYKGGFAFFTPNTKLTTGLPWPHYHVNLGMIVALYPPIWFAIEHGEHYPPAKPGQKCRVGIRQWLRSNRQPGLTLWVELVWQ